MSRTSDNIDFDADKTMELTHVEDPTKPHNEQHHVQKEAVKSALDTLGTYAAMRVFWKATLVASAIAFSGVCDGYQIQLNGSIVSNKGFIAQFATKTNAAGARILDPTYVSAWGGCLSVGQCCAMLLCSVFGNKLGRKKTLYVVWIVMVASVFAETFAATPPVWLIGKLLAGAAIGGIQSTLPVFISEIAPVQLRAALVNAYTIWYLVGQLLAPLVLQQFNVHQPLVFKPAIYSQWAWVGLAIIFWAAVPESPWWLVEKGKVDQARKVLNQLRGNVKGFDVEVEIEIMQNAIAAEDARAAQDHGIPWYQIFRGTDGYRTFIASIPKVLQQLVGLAVVNSYSTYFFQLAGNKDPFLVTVIIAVVQIVGVMMTAGLGDIRRRPMVVYMNLGASFCLLAVGIIGCFDYASKSLGSLLVFVCCLANFLIQGASALGYSYVAELPSQRLRSRTAAFALSISSMFGICFAFAVPIMLTGAPMWGIKTGFFFAATGIPGSLIAWWFIPETAQRSGAELDEMFAKGVHPRKFRVYVTDAQREAKARAEAEGIINAGTGGQN